MENRRITSFVNDDGASCGAMFLYKHVTNLRLSFLINVYSFYNTTEQHTLIYVCLWAWAGPFVVVPHIYTSHFVLFSGSEPYVKVKTHSSSMRLHFLNNYKFM